MAQDEEKTIDQLNEEADIAADYLEGLLDIVDYEGDIEMGVRNNRPTVQIVADDDTDIKHLIGRNGEVVDASAAADATGRAAEDRRAFPSHCGRRRLSEAQAPASARHRAGRHRRGARDGGAG